MRFVAGIVMVISVLISIVIFLIGNSIFMHIVAILPMIIAFLLGRTIVHFHENEKNILTKLIEKEAAVQSNIEKEKAKLLAIKQSANLLNQVDFTTEVLPTKELERFELASLINYQKKNG